MQSILNPNGFWSGIFPFWIIFFSVSNQFLIKKIQGKSRCYNYFSKERETHWDPWTRFTDGKEIES